MPPSAGHVELSLVLCDDERITSLNAEYRGKDGPTDVLSFPIGDFLPKNSGIRILGDLVLSLDTAARQAKERRHAQHTPFTLQVQ
jgi:probable rRNA maturation factor